MTRHATPCHPDMTIQPKPNFILFHDPAFYRLASPCTYIYHKCPDTVLSPSTNDVDSGVWSFLRKRDVLCFGFFFPLQLLFIYTYIQARNCCGSSSFFHFVCTCIYLAYRYGMVLHLLVLVFFCLHRIVTLFPCMTDSDSDSLALLWLWLCSGTHAHTHQDSFFFLPLLNCSLHLVRLVVPNQCCSSYHFLSLWSSDVEADCI